MTPIPSPAISPSSCSELVDDRGDRPSGSERTRWQKGELLGSGTFGNVYVGIDSDSGALCAMKEVLLLCDESISKERVKQLGQEISLFSRLRHQNIVKYIGTELLDDLLADSVRISISTLDLKGANILLDTNGKVILADFGMAQHITAQSFPLSFTGSPYWMAPEVIKQTDGYDLAVDIWSLRSTVLEMATAKLSWSQYEGWQMGVMYKIGNSQELPAIPSSLSPEGKDFVRFCLQRDPSQRPSE